MPRTDVPHNQLSRAGTILGSGGPNEITGDVGNDHSVVYNDDLIVMIRNSDASPHNVTFITQKTVDGELVPDKTVAVAAGDTQAFSGFAASIYRVQSGADKNSIQVDVDDATLFLQAFLP